MNRPPSQDQITGLVLAGGRGSRMGGVDKGLQPYQGRPLVQHALQRLAPQVGSLMINANRNLDTYAALGVPVWPDALSDYPGPLAGLAAGLAHCRTAYLVSVPCDSPHFPTDLVQRLAAVLAEHDAEIAMAAAVEDGTLRAQPVFCLLQPRLLPSLLAFLHSGQRKVDRWTATHRCVDVRFDNAAAFFNANTLAELQQLQHTGDSRRHTMAMPRLWAGASGYAFKEWKGNFYPEKIEAQAMLAWYAERLPSVEINNSFYQTPKVEVLQRWAQATPEAFRFAIKAPRRITHDARLAADAAADSVAYLYKNLAALGAKRGPVLFQLPPFLKKDTARLQDFLRLLPEGHRAAFEFRHDSWFDDDVYALLKAAGASLCLSEREDSAPPPLIETTPWGYVRLRLEHYSDADLAAWAERLAGTQWQEVHAYFMHEPTAPGYAAALLAKLPAP